LERASHLTLWPGVTNVWQTTPRSIPTPQKSLSSALSRQKTLAIFMKSGIFVQIRQ
jgi:hypothetical protein